MSTILKKPEDVSKAEWFEQVIEGQPGPAILMRDLDFYVVGHNGCHWYRMAYDEENDELWLDAFDTSVCHGCDDVACSGCGSCILQSTEKLTDSHLKRGFYVGR